MNRENAIDYITQVDWRHSRLGLERMDELLLRMGAPHRRLRFAHVAGTNGKGSVCAMLASVLGYAGYTTGLYTSPFINRFNERIQVNGVPIPDEDLAEVTEAVRRHADAMADHPTEFELVTAIAFEYFARRGCDIVVLEVGLGGRLDATNIIPPPLVAAITPISLDHTAELGPTVAEIAGEKAGIIKPGCRVVSAPQLPEALDVLRRVCDEKAVPLAVVDAGDITATRHTLEGQHFSYKAHKDLILGLLGTYQPENAAVVIEALACLEDRLPVTEDALHRGLAAARWPARFELVHRQPAVIVDGGHNPQGAAALAENLAAYFPGQKPVLVAGVMADKDYGAMFRPMVPLAGDVFAVAPEHPRALPAKELAAWFRQNGAPGATACPTVTDGLKKALAAAGPDGLVCAFGSFYMAGAIRAHFDLT